MEPREGMNPTKGETGCYGSLVDMKKEHVALAAQMGVNTIRCGIEHGSLEDRDHPGRYSDDGFAQSRDSSDGAASIISNAFSISMQCLAWRTAATVPGIARWFSSDGVRHGRRSRGDSKTTGKC